MKLLFKIMLALFNTNKLSIGSNGSEKIQGSTDNFQCDINNATVSLIYQDATKGWTADNISNPVEVSYLVIAGGGGGPSGYQAGGGGAGGYRSAWNNESSGVVMLLKQLLIYPGELLYCYCRWWWSRRPSFKCCN